MSTLLLGLLLAPCVALAAAADPSPDPGPVLRCTFLRGKGDTFASKPVPGGHELRLDCASRIGEARVVVAEGDLPGVVVVRLGGLPALEGFGYADGKWKLQGGINTEGRSIDEALDRDGNRTDDPKKVAVSLRAERQKGDFVVTVKYHGVKPGKDLSVHWIDHYRR